MAIIHERVTIDPNIMQGESVIRGTRITDVVFVQDTEPGADGGRIMALVTAQNRLLVDIAPEQRHRTGQRLARAVAGFGDRLIGHHTVIQAHRSRCGAFRDQCPADGT